MGEDSPGGRGSGNGRDRDNGGGDTLERLRRDASLTPEQRLFAAVLSRMMDDNAERWRDIAVTLREVQSESRAVVDEVRSLSHVLTAGQRDIVAAIDAHHAELLDAKTHLSTSSTVLATFAEIRPGDVKALQKLAKDGVPPAGWGGVVREASRAPGFVREIVLLAVTLAAIALALWIALSQSRERSSASTPNEEQGRPETGIAETWHTGAVYDPDLGMYP